MSLPGHRHTISLYVTKGLNNKTVNELKVNESNAKLSQRQEIIQTRVGTRRSQENVAGDWASASHVSLPPWKRAISCAVIHNQLPLTDKITNTQIYQHQTHTAPQTNSHTPYRIKHTPEAHEPDPSNPITQLTQTNPKKQDFLDHNHSTFISQSFEAKVLSLNVNRIKSNHITQIIFLKDTFNCRSHSVAWLHLRTNAHLSHHKHLLNCACSGQNGSTGENVILSRGLGEMLLLCMPCCFTD